MENITKVGVATIVIKDKKVLMYERKGPNGNKVWGFPGGHLEFGETFEECVTRETNEEAGIELEKIRFASCTNDFFKEKNAHYVTIFMTANYKYGDPKALEPNIGGEWFWFKWDEIPSPLFPTIKTLIDTGFNPFETNV